MKKIFAILAILPLLGGVAQGKITKKFLYITAKRANATTGFSQVLSADDNFKHAVIDFTKSSPTITVGKTSINIARLGEVRFSQKEVDAEQIMQYYLGTLPSGTTFDSSAADVNNDNKVTMGDANVVVNK